ncbi:MAG: hypothetical protein NE327_20770 [Lentisphaeraceae bacterium]|nr:hypothetical protein [Lentisphaeraceae bacterium]
MKNKITIGKVTSPNPHLFLNLDTLDSEEREYTIATSVSSGGNWISVNQFCSLMALHWLNNGTPQTFSFNDFSKEEQEEAAGILINYANLDSQVQYAVQNTGGSVKNLYEFTQYMSQKQKSKKIWFGSDRHVVAAVIDENGNISLYDPNTGNSEAVENQSTLVKIASSMSANVFVVADLDANSGNDENDSSDDNVFVILH